MNSQKKQQKCKKTCTPKEAADQMIENLKKDLMAKQTSLQSTIENESSSDEDILARNWSKVQQQMKELKRENKRLKEDNFKQILDAMRELPTVVTQLKEVIGQITVQTAPHASTSATASTSVDSASVSPQVLSDDMVFLMPGCNVKVPKRKINSLRMANPSVYIGDLAVLVYGRETLSHSSLTGRQSGAHKDVESKPQLDSTKLDAIFATYIQSSELHIPIPEIE
ncbi:BEN domain-containing protein 6-like [Pseudorasbora parva]|uniref:BEN domain-containing protein 6-like n=1 Tax=Pseudorasbora parva TaxID=51549 RepID=UPI00351E8D4B